MRESIHRYFRVGTISWMSFPNLSAVDAVKRVARDDYFDAIEITQCNSQEERETIPRNARKSKAFWSSHI